MYVCRLTHERQKCCAMLARLPATLTFWDKFVLLLWKNVLLTLRNKWQLLFEFIFLFLVCGILLSVRIYRAIYVQKLLPPLLSNPGDIYVMNLRYVD